MDNGVRGVRIFDYIEMRPSPERELCSPLVTTAGDAVLWPSWTQYLSNYVGFFLDSSFA